MEENYGKWIVTDNRRRSFSEMDVAEHVDLEPSSLCKKIHNELSQLHIHITCSQYIDGLRVKKAKKMFQNNRYLYCYQVAEKVGTGDRNFRKIFKTFTGKSPSEYRFEVFLGKNSSASPK